MNSFLLKRHPKQSAIITCLFEVINTEDNGYIYIFLKLYDFHFLSYANKLHTVFIEELCSLYL